LGEVGRSKLSPSKTWWRQESFFLFFFLILIFFIIKSLINLKFRHRIYSEEEIDTIGGILWMYCKEDPTTRPKEYQKILREWGFDVKIEYIRAIFRKWR
jgi:hypothetical protein